MTWTATERNVGDRWLSIVVKEEKDVFVCRLEAPINDDAAIEQMRARARLIVQAEAMLVELKELIAWIDDSPNHPNPPSKGVIRGGEIFQQARAIIKATGGEDE